MAPPQPRAQIDVTLAIIAGGRARRLGGVPKGLITLEGRSLLARLIDLVPCLGLAEVLLVAADPQPYASFGLRTIADLIPGRGAPGGVHAALAASPTDWVLAVGADMPFVTAPVVEALLRSRGGGAEVIAFQALGRIEPLLALYHRQIEPRWRRALATQPSFGELFEGFECRLLSEAALRALDPELRSIASVNTEEDAVRLGVQLP